MPPSFTLTGDLALLNLSRTRLEELVSRSKTEAEGLGCSEVERFEKLNRDYQALISDARKKAVLACHPDLHPGLEDALAQTQDINAAYDRLKTVHLAPRPKPQPLPRPVFVFTGFSMFTQSWTSSPTNTTTTFHMWAEPNWRGRGR